MRQTSRFITLGLVTCTGAMGEKPGGAVTRMQEYTATDISQRRREVTLRLPDEATRTFTVRPDIDLSQRKVGQQAAVRVTVGVAISVEGS